MAGDQALVSRVRHARSCCQWRRSMLALPADLKRFMDEGKHLTVDQMPQMASPPELGLAQMPQPLLQAPSIPQGVSPFRAWGHRVRPAVLLACIRGALQWEPVVHLNGQTWGLELPAALGRGHADAQAGC